MTGPLAIFSEMAKSRDEVQDNPDLYPGSKQVRRAVSGVSADPWVHFPFVELPDRGTLRRFYQIGVLAKMLGKSAQTIRKWEQWGYMPSCEFRFAGTSSANNRREGQRRLYTRDQIEGIVRIARETGVLTSNKAQSKSIGTSGFPAKAHELFKELRS